MKNIVITGMTGFVGSNLKDYLRSNYSLKGVSRSVSNDQSILFENLSLKILNESKALIHLAGKAHDLKKVSKPESYFEVNTDLTIQLYDKFLKSNCEVFVFMSTVKAAADKVKNVLLEDNKPNPITPYGKSKLKAENYILSNPAPKSKRVFILRPCMVHGPNNKGNLNLLYKLVKKRIPWPLGSFENKRSYCGIDNLCFVIGELVNRKEIPSGIYNVSDDLSLGTNQLVRFMAKELNIHLKIINVPKKIITILAKFGDIIGISFNSENLEKLTDSYVVGNGKLKKALGINNFPFTLEENLKKTINSYDTIN